MLLISKKIPHPSSKTIGQGDRGARRFNPKTHNPRTSVNRNSLETGQMSRSQIFSFYFHCIKILVNRNPSTPETGQTFYYF